MEKYLVLERRINGGVQKIYKFDNGYGASVVRHMFSYGFEKGLWEVALLTFTSDTEWTIHYRNDFYFGDVARNLTDEEVIDTLKWIENL